MGGDFAQMGDWRAARPRVGWLAHRSDREESACRVAAHKQRGMDAEHVDRMYGEGPGRRGPSFGVVWLLTRRRPPARGAASAPRERSRAAGSATCPRRAA